jgi:uncharacterized membrane protein YdjX (TVP38/TMEM64 family)
VTGHNVLKIIILIVIVGLGTYGFFHSGIYVYFINKDDAIAFVNSFYPFDLVAFVSLQILQVVFAPIPGEVTGIIGGFLYGPVLGTIYSTIGLTIGSWLAFILARYFGLSFVERALKPETVKKYDYVLEHQGSLIAFVLFFIPGFPKDCLCYIMGLSHMKIWTFLIVSTVGRLFGTMLLSVCGSCARNGQYLALAIAFGVSGVCILVAYLYREKLMEVIRRKKTV